eukprot:1794158-Prymnesium_polylepis.2
MPTTVCMEHRDWALSHHARPTHFLLYLNFETFVGDHGAQLAEEVRKAMAAKLPFVMLHENDPDRMMAASLSGAPLQ